MFLKQHWFVNVFRNGLQIRAALTTLIYKKVLRLSNSSLKATSVGQILNILSNDLNRYDEFFRLYTIVITPIQAGISVWLMWGYLDVSTMGGVVIMILFVPLQGWMGHMFGKFRNDTSSLTDTRVKLMSEIIAAMKLIKVYCWEKPFADTVRDVRSLEMSKIRWTSLLRGINLGLYFVSTRAMLFATLVLYVCLGNQLTAEKVFVVMSLFNGLRIPVTFDFPMAIGTAAELMVGMRRIQRILMLEEKGREPITSTNQQVGEIIFNDYSAKWNKQADNAALRNLNLKVSPGELVVVIGPVGAGKSCLLYALLNEIEPVNGSCLIKGVTAYSPQESWCFSGTIRENILLGNAYDPLKYQEVVRVCGLRRDLELFSNGDQTHVGEKGFTLSGGQKARVTLARAVYHEADIYLLDDPLSAVDPAVANHIFRKCIKGYLKKRNKTVVLVTHQIQFLQQADKIFIVDSGTNTIPAGNFTQLVASGVNIVAYLDSGNHDQLDRQESLQEMTESEMKAELARQKEQEETAVRQAAGREELAAKGSVGTTVYWQFLRAGGSKPLLLLVLSMIIISQAVFQYTDFWLSAWAASYEIVEGNSTKVVIKSFAEEKTNIIIYGLITTVLFVSTLARTALLYIVCLNSSRRMHNRIFSKVLRAPMSFFETNPIGRILNRFTYDIGLIDQLVPQTLIDCEIVSTDLY